MSKSRRIAVIVGLSLFVLAVVGAVAGPRAIASVSHMTYREATYSYSVEMDKVYDTEPKSFETGIIVAISPDRPSNDASEFSEVYLEATRERAMQWVAERRVNVPMDVMVVFARPLTLVEANAVLDSAEANVFESGVVGYADDVPFAEYMKEGGPFLTRSLKEYAEAHSGLEAEMMEGDAFEDKSSLADVRGYLAIRAWVQVRGLEALLENEDVRTVDTTPQEVRNQLASSLHWKNMPITAVAIEMPVWAYEW